LYYSDRTTLGNENLKPESALAFELGFRFSGVKSSLSASYFNRNSNNLIDYVKNKEEELWQANNIQKVTTNGFELEYKQTYSIFDFSQNIQLGYTYIDDKVKGTADYALSRYSINSLKNHFTIRSFNKLSNNLSSSIVVKKACSCSSCIDSGLVKITKRLSQNIRFF
jgi:iron complex outermembrane receptor protein